MPKGKRRRKKIAPARIGDSQSRIREEVKKDQKIENQKTNAKVALGVASGVAIRAYQNVKKKRKQ